MPEVLVRVHIWVEGRVQGVGFRAFVAQSAGFIGVNGWVRNLSWDGVEAVAEGTRAQVDQFIQAVRTGPRAAHVVSCRVEEEPTGAVLSGFEIRSSR